jgi:hypothetical protein
LNAIPSFGFGLIERFVGLPKEHFPNFVRLVKGFGNGSDTANADGKGMGRKVLSKTRRCTLATINPRTTTAISKGG